MTQDVVFRCEQCGRALTVTPTLSPYEFDADCACGFAYRLSWFHGDPPPTFPAARMPARSEPTLWD